MTGWGSELPAALPLMMTLASARVRPDPPAAPSGDAKVPTRHQRHELIRQNVTRSCPPGRQQPPPTHCEIILLNGENGRPHIFFQTRPVVSSRYQVSAGCNVEPHSLFIPPKVLRNFLTSYLLGVVSNVAPFLRRESRLSPCRNFACV